MEQQELPEYIQEQYEEPEQVVQSNIDPDIYAGFKIVDLPIVVPYTGEQDETTLAKFKVKLYRFRDEQWKQRGVGMLKFLKHNENQWTRIIMRAEKIGMIRLNHKVLQKDNLCELKKHLFQKAWLWSAEDYSDGHLSIEKLSARFNSDEDYENFAIEFAKACQENKILQEQNQASDSNESNDQEA